MTGSPSRRGERRDSDLYGVPDTLAASPTVTNDEYGTVVSSRQRNQR